MLPLRCLVSAAGVVYSDGYTRKARNVVSGEKRAKGRVAIKAGQQSRWGSSKSVITWFISTASVKDHYRHPDQHRFNCKNSRFKRNNFKLVEQSFWLTFGAVVGEAGAEPIMSWSVAERRLVLSCEMSIVFVEVGLLVKMRMVLNQRSAKIRFWFNLHDC